MARITTSGTLSAAVADAGTFTVSYPAPPGPEVGSTDEGDFYQAMEHAIVIGQTVSIPTGVSQFPKEIFAASRRWADRSYTDIRHWRELPRGGHFAAFEEPDLFVSELRDFFRLIR